MQDTDTPPAPLVTAAETNPLLLDTAHHSTQCSTQSSPNVAATTETLLQSENQLIQASILAPIESDDNTTPLPTTKQPAKSQTSDNVVTPAHLRPLPIYKKSKINTRKRKIQKAEVLTSTPIKEEQKAKMVKKKLIELKKEGQKRKPKYSMTISESTASTSGIKGRTKMTDRKEDN